MCCPVAHRLRLDQSGVVCGDHGLDAGADAEFAKHVGDVALDGGLAEGESFGEFFVGEPACE